MITWNHTSKEIWGTSKDTSEGVVGLIQPVVNLSPTCSTHTVEVMLSALSSPPLVPLDVFLGGKRETDDILIHIFLYAILRVERVKNTLFFSFFFPSLSCSVMLFDSGYFF